MKIEENGMCRWGRRATIVVLLVIATIHFLRRPAPNVPTLAGQTQLHGFTVVIDAGHGGEDGGAVSPSGTVESGINLEIALRLDAILGLYGADTVLLRTEDISLHDPDVHFQ